MSGSIAPAEFDSAGQAWNVNPQLLAAVSQVESGNQTFTPQGRLVTSSAGAQGPMQFMPQTAARYAVNPANPVSSVYGAAHYMRDLLDQTGGNVPAALQLYNGAPSDPRQGYTGKILAAFHSINPIASAQAAEAPSIDVGPSYSPTTPQGQPGSEVYSPPGGTSPKGQQGGVGEQGGISLTVTPTGPAAQAAKWRGIFGPKPPPTTTETPQATPQTAKWAGVFGPTPPSAAPAVAQAPQPGVGPVAPQAAPGIPPVQLTTPAAAAPVQITSPPIAPQAAAAPQALPPSPIPLPPWVQRNIYNPLAAAVNPQVPPIPGNNLLGAPTLQTMAAAVMQGGRDFEQTLNNVGNWAGAQLAPEQPIPADIAAAQAATAAATAGYRQQYRTSPLAQGTEAVTNALIAAPLLRPIEAAGAALAPEMPVLQGAIRGGIAGGGTDILASGGTGQDPYGVYGALGGGALGAAFPAVGNMLVRGGRREVANVANQLDIPLSLGQRMGGAYQRVEQLAGRVLPFTGAGTRAAQQRRAIANFFRREMGISGEGHFNSTDLAGFLNQIGQRMRGHAMNMTLRADQRTAGRLLRLWGEARKNVDPLQRQLDPLVARESSRMQQRLEMLARRGGGDITGSDFLDLIKKDGEIDKLTGSDDQAVRRFGAELRDILFDAMERNPNNSLADRQGFRASRYAYKVGKTIERAIGHGLTGTEEIRLPGVAQDIRRRFAWMDPNGMLPIQRLAQLLGSTPDVASSGTAENLALLKAFGVLGGGAALHQWDPKRFDEYVATYGPELGALYAALLSGNLGPALSTGRIGALRQAVSPLAPRLFGYWAGRGIAQHNPLGSPPGQQRAAP